jgi:hypothetical protein
MGELLLLLLAPFLAGVVVGMTFAPPRFWCPRCNTFAGNAWELGTHLGECGRQHRSLN